MQFGFMPGCSTADMIFILRQMHEKHDLKQITMYAAFVDLEKASNRVLCKVLWWGLRKVEIDECVVCLVKAMFSNSLSSVRVTGSYVEPFKVTVVVHQGSVLSPLLLIILESVVHGKYYMPKTLQS